MPRQVYAFEPPERFVAGTVGQPGDRTFYLQASGGGRTVSVVLEKMQVAVLAERLGELLDEAARQLDEEIPAVPGEAIDLEPLLTPLDEEFRVGTLGLAWDTSDSTVIVEATATPPEGQEDVDEEDLDVLRVRLSPEATRAFVARALRLVAAGRPTCPFCGQPLDPAGHICPRQNGYRR